VDVTTDVIDAGEIIAAADERATASDRADAERDLLDQSADNGTLYDADEVSSSVVNDTAVAWTDNVDIDDVAVTEAETAQPVESDAKDDESGVGLGITATNSPDDVDVAVANQGSTATAGVSGRWGDTDGGAVQVTSG
jgi:hypothetical protein